MSKLLSFLFVIFACMQLSSCSTDRRSQLEDSVDNYIKALRRGDESMAMSFVNPEKHDAYFKNYQKLGDLYVSNAEVKTIFPDEKLENAVSTVLLEFFSQSGTMVTTQKRKLSWKYEAKLKGWILDEEAPFGTR